MVLLVSTNCLLPIWLMPRDHSIHRQRHITLRVCMKRPSQLKEIGFLLHCLEPRKELLPKLFNANLVTWMQLWLVPNPPRQSHNPNERCPYHMESSGHHINVYWPLKHKAQDLIDSGVIGIEFPTAQGMSQNPLPLYNTVGPSTQLFFANLSSISPSFSSFCLHRVLPFRYQHFWVTFFQWSHLLSLS